MSEESTTAAPGTEPKSYTQEELNEMRKNVHEFYKKQIGFFKTEAEYERLQAEIEESKLRRIVAIQRQAYLYAQNEQAMHEAAASDPLGTPEQKEQPEESPDKLNMEMKGVDGKQPRKLKVE